VSNGGAGGYSEQQEEEGRCSHGNGKGSALLAGLDCLQRHTARPSAKPGFERKRERESATVARSPAACHSLHPAPAVASRAWRSLDSAAPAGMEEATGEHGGSGHRGPYLTSPGKEAARARSPRWGGRCRRVECRRQPEQKRREEAAGSSVGGPRFTCISTSSLPSSRID
jgi:hypothetical protein